MPVLLLCRGDNESKDLLRSAIESRYGYGPPAIETLSLRFDGTIHTRVGPSHMKLPLNLQAHFRFPYAFHTDYSAKMMGVAVKHQIEMFDGENYARGTDTQIITNPEEITSRRQRVWLMSAMLLTPLTEHYVTLEFINDLEFSATHRDTEDKANIFLKPDYTVDYMYVDCLNPDTGKQQRYTLRVADGHTTVDELILPTKLHITWDDDPFIDLHPATAEVNPELPETLFAPGAQSQ